MRDAMIVWKINWLVNYWTRRARDWLIDCGVKILMPQSRLIERVPRARNAGCIDSINCKHYWLNYIAELLIIDWYWLLLIKLLIIFD